ncbi:hypothetical protein SUGI_0687580 [Cryptomeria japonica]|uniref:E3 ubiquitin-protein ligase RDUF1-like n=1 Tax=Cryptomeria japonica TaxID=3369 RepID=UPI002414758B|nr:E3 ubiquitin-protein ligase RDUF1-like [Cryptomeria japonica]GLJ34212.1 hypothetical protein SUGI_0687580 [Cryptomeria japonica]
MPRVSLTYERRRRRERRDQSRQFLGLTSGQEQVPRIDIRPQNIDEESRSFAAFRRDVDVALTFREITQIGRERRREEFIHSSRRSFLSDEARDSLIRPFENVYRRRHRSRDVEFRPETTQLEVATEDMTREARLFMAAFDTIKVSVVHINEVPVCVICLTEYMVGEDASQMPCHKNHIFHPDCLYQWLERKRSCPLCKAMVSYPLPPPA